MRYTKHIKFNKAFFKIFLLTVLTGFALELNAQLHANINSLSGIGSPYRERSIAIDMDDSLNMYIAGYTRGKPDYNLNSGNFVPVNGNSTGCFLIKYNKNNDAVWGYHTGYPENVVGITQLKCLNDDKILIAGYYYGNAIDIDFSINGVALLKSSNNNYSLFTAIYDGNGNLLHHAELVALHDSLNVMLGDRTFISDVAFDKNNTIYVSGYCGDVMLPDASASDTLKEFNFFYAKYDSSLTLQWLHHLPKEVKEFHNWTNFRPLFSNVDDAGCLYVSMTFCDSLNLHFENEPADFVAATPYDYQWNPFSNESNNTDIIIIKYDADGKYIKHRQFGSTVYSRNELLDIEVAAGNRIIALTTYSRTMIFSDSVYTASGWDSLNNLNLMLVELDTALNVIKHLPYYNNILHPRGGNNLLSADDCGNILLRSNLIISNGFPFPPFDTNDHYVLSRVNLYLFDKNLKLTDSIEAGFYEMADFSAACIRHGKITLFNTYQQSQTIEGLTVFETPSGTGQDEYDVYLAKFSYNDCGIINSEPPQILFPNVFTPNGDGVNEFFEPGLFENIESAELKIFNRWGEVVFNSSEIVLWWNGENKNGNECPAGVYFYLVSYKSNGKAGNLKGTVTLLR